MTKLKDIRIARGYQTAKSFAEYARIPYGTYVRYENDPYSMTTARLVYISEKLKVSTDEVLGLKEFNKSEITRNFDFSDELRRLKRYIDEQNHLVAKFTANNDHMIDQWNAFMSRLRMEVL